MPPEAETGLEPSRHPNDAGSPSGDPVGGRLRFFLPMWQQTTSDRGVLEIISNGYKIEFLQQPTLKFAPFPTPVNPLHRKALWDSLQFMLRQKAVVQVPAVQRYQGLYSRFFIVTKATVGFRTILDLRSLNRNVRVTHFKMEALNTILPDFREGMFMTTIDLKDAYLHIPINPKHQKSLRFHVFHRHFQFVALPFDLPTSPRTFTKVLVVIAARLRADGVQMWPYLDDILIAAESEDLAYLHTQKVISVLQQHGWIIN